MPTVTEWLGILETTGQIILVPPFFENFGKRLIKSPKLYFADSGLACHLLGIESEEELARSVFLGPVFEGFVASEIVKLQTGGGVGASCTSSATSRGWRSTSLCPWAERGWLSSRPKFPERCTPPWPTRWRG